MKNEEIELAEVIQQSEEQFITTVENINQSAQIIATTSGSIYDLSKQFMDLKRDLALMDIQFDSYLAKLENDRALFNKKATIINGLLQSTSERMDVILKRLLQNDFSSLKQEDVEMRRQLITLLSEQNDNFCDMFLKLMSK